MSQVESRRIGYARGTYAGSTGYFTPAATPTDVFGLINSATTNRIVKLLRLSISTQETAATFNNVLLLLRSTADTGGGPVTVRPITTDQSSAASLATCVQYASNPALGTLVNTTGLLKTVTLLSASATTPNNIPGDTDFVLFDDQYEGQPITLRSGAAGTATGQGVYVNLAGATLGAGFTMCINLIWTEE